MGRKPKYPDAEQVISSFYAAVSDSYNSPSEDEKGRDGHKKQEIIAEEFGISRLKVRKILITTGDLVYPETHTITAMMEEGMKMDAVYEKLRMGRSTVNSLIPYQKGVYKLSEVSAAAERTQVYRARKAAVIMLQSDPTSLNLWNGVCLFAGYPFQTSGRGNHLGSKFKYEVAEAGGTGGKHYEGESIEGFGNELWIVSSSGEKREKSISRSSVDYALKIALEGSVTGPKQLKIYGASYVYALFKRFGVV